VTPEIWEHCADALRSTTYVLVRSWQPLRSRPLLCPSYKPGTATELFFREPTSSRKLHRRAPCSPSTDILSVDLGVVLRERSTTGSTATVVLAWACPGGFNTWDPPNEKNAAFEGGYTGGAQRCQDFRWHVHRELRSVCGSHSAGLVLRATAERKTREPKVTPQQVSRSAPIHITTSPHPSVIDHSA